MNEKLQNLTEEQMKELATKTTPEDVITYLKSIGVELTEDEIAQLSEVPDDALEGAAGGFLPTKQITIVCSNSNCDYREVRNTFAMMVGPTLLIMRCPKCNSHIREE